LPPCRSSVYSISKAAAFSLSQSLRALFAGRDVSVHAVMAGPIDTDMVRDLDIPKTSPEAVARGIFDGVERGEEKIFPDPMSETMADSWHRSGQGARAPEGGAPRSRARRMSNRRGPPRIFGTARGTAALPTGPARLSMTTKGEKPMSEQND
jgi:NAD(P)-dependent dehydrogenase (short-subunit alcohol dehydrogenase family)